MTDKLDWTKPICTAPTDWQASIDAELVCGPNAAENYTVRILDYHFIHKGDNQHRKCVGWGFNKKGFFFGAENDPDYIRIINRPACEDTGNIDPAPYERIVKLVKQIPTTLLPADVQDEIHAIIAELEPVDPILKLAREVCDEVAPRYAGQRYTGALYDNEVVMRAALAMAKAMKERGL